uniref:CDGSH iron-sulfur domain-containing protein 2 n=1 Tax=Petromyzon marinus TaxID=7757 RepID=S4RJZ5_PETMA
LPMLDYSEVFSVSREALLGKQIPSRLMYYFSLLAVGEWVRLLPFLSILALLGYLAIRPLLPRKVKVKDSVINLKIQKETSKVVNEINIEDFVDAKKAYCRCWRSKTFPACDGSHNRHNEETGDNVGPLIIKRKDV